MYKNVRVVKFFDLEALGNFLANSTQMGPLEYKPRIEFIYPYRTEEKAHEIAEEALVLLQKLPRAFSKCKRGEESELELEPEPESQWTTTLKATESRVFGRGITFWLVILLHRDSLEV